MLTADVLARICHPTNYRDVQEWFRALLARGDSAPEIIVSVLSDYQLRRTLLDMDADESLRQLDELARTLRYVPVTAEAARRAAELRQTLQSPAGGKLSDADLLVAAQASIEGAVLVTKDVDLRHMASVSAKEWSEIGS
jgi:predicted nucleic acid-binding protein